MRCKNYKTACETAQANANSSGVSWKVFRDTSGAWNAERNSPMPKATTIFAPKPKAKIIIDYTTANMDDELTRDVNEILMTSEAFSLPKHKLIRILRTKFGWKLSTMFVRKQFNGAMFDFGFRVYHNPKGITIER